MSKIKLTGSNSGYVELDSAADAGNLTLQLPTAGTALLSNAGNVFTGITTFTGVNITDDITFNGASYNVVWDKSDNQLEFGDNAKLSFGASSDMQLYHNGSNSLIQDNGTGHIQIRSGTFTIGNFGLTKTSAIFNSGAEQELRFNNSTKFVTTNTGAVVTGICTATSFSGSGEGLTYTSPLSHRNIVINGDMRVAQRASSASMSSSGNDIPACDRWNYNRNGPSATVAQVAEVPDASGFRYSLKWTNTSPVGSIAAGNALFFAYNIERQDIQRLGYGYSNGKTATLSFYAKGSLAGKIGMSCTRDGRIFSANVDMTANTWQRHTIGIPADTSTAFSANDTASGFLFRFCWGAGSNATSGATNSWINFHNAYTAGFTAGQQGAYLATNGSTFQITGVQLEIGSQATPFEFRRYGDNLMDCYRYYVKLYTNTSDFPFGMGYKYAATAHAVSVQLPTQMRTTPTCTFDNLRVRGGKMDGVNNQETVTSLSAMSYSNANFQSFTVNTNANNANIGQAVMLTNAVSNSSSYINFDAEL